MNECITAVAFLMLSTKHAATSATHGKEAQRLT